MIDRDFGTAPAPQQARVMSFEPEEAGEYEHYVYAGQGKDILAEDSAGPFRRIALAGSNRLVTASRKQIREYPTGGGETPICTFEVKGGQAAALAANPLSGEVFYFVEGAHSKLRRLGPCNEATGEFAELQGPLTPSPETEALYGLAINPSLSWGPLRSEGVLYGADAEDPTTPNGIGDVFAPAESESQPPAIEAESVTATTATSTTLQARIDPKGSAVAFHFEYLSEAEYLADGESFEGPERPPPGPALPRTARRRLGRDRDRGDRRPATRHRLRLPRDRRAQRVRRRTGLPRRGPPRRLSHLPDGRPRACPTAAPMSSSPRPRRTAARSSPPTRSSSAA